MKKVFKKSNKLKNVLYDVRGEVLQEAKRMEEEGLRVLKLNIGNTAPFGFEAPEEILHDLTANIHAAEGYSDSQGIFSARKAVMQYYQAMGLDDIGVDDVYLGNGVSELIVMAMQGLLNNGDEILIPSPDYPLWTAAVALGGGRGVHYICDEKADWQPDLADIKSKITRKTKAIVIINPNNPTGAVYSRAFLQELADLAVQHGLIIFSDEIYDKVLYDDAVHTSIALLARDTLTITFGGLSKVYRAPGFRAGWMVLSGKKDNAVGYIEGLQMLSNMRLCSNLFGQLTIQTALGGHQSIYDLTKPGGRLYEQRNFAYEKICAIPGVSCVKPMGAMYLFPKIDVKKYNITDDKKMILEFLRQEKVLLVQGTGFNLKTPDHIRIVFLPHIEDLGDAINRFARFLEGRVR